MNRMPSLRQLAVAKKTHRRTTTVLMRDHLKDNFGIVTEKDLCNFLNRNVIKGKQESNYDILVRMMGEGVAMKLMRRLEIMSWSEPSS